MNARSVGRLASGDGAASVDWFDDATPGLALRVYGNGRTRTWFLFYKKGRTSRRVKLGRWPSLALSKARQLARQHRVRIETEGADPAHERAEEREAFTVDNLAKLYLKQHAKTKKRTWRDDEWRLNRYILPAWGTRSVRDIRRGDAHVLLDKIAADKPIQANRIQALISKLWNFAIDREQAEMNICHRMAKRAPERKRTRVLTDDELRALWKTTEENPGDAADALRLRLLTGQRGGEIHSIKWSDVDLAAAVWTIPAELAKNGIEHRVPLSPSALDLLTRRHGVKAEKETRVFPGLYHQREDLRALGSMRAGEYRWHDLRRTVATRLAQAGFHDETIGRVLNHAKRGITATVYNQYQYDAEKRGALQAWSEQVSLLTSSPG